MKSWHKKALLFHLLPLAFVWYFNDFFALKFAEHVRSGWFLAYVIPWAVLWASILVFSVLGILMLVKWFIGKSQPFWDWVNRDDGNWLVEDETDRFV